MSQFLNHLQLECLGDRQYRSLNALQYQSDLAGLTIIVPAGEITDLLSTWGLPIISETFDGDAPEPGAMHDYLYSCKMFTRAISDALLREACIAYGLPKWKAWVIWAGVRIGGGSHWNPKPALL